MPELSNWLWVRGTQQQQRRRQQPQHTVPPAAAVEDAGAAAAVVRVSAGLQQPAAEAVACCPTVRV